SRIAPPGHRWRRAVMAPAPRGTEPLDRRYLPARKDRDRRDRGTLGAAGDDHRAGAALRETAAEFGAVEAEIIPQHVEQRRLRIGLDRMGLAVDVEGDHPLLPTFAL